MSATPSIIDRIAQRQRDLEARLKGNGDGFSLPAPGRLAYLCGKDKLGYSDPGAAVIRQEIDQSAMAVPCIVTRLKTDDMGDPLPDRDGDVVIPAGCVETLAEYALNPVVFFGHQAIMLPIGTAEHPDGSLSVKVYSDHILSWTRFHQHTQDAVDVFKLVNDGFLKSLSIGFIPLQAEPLPQRAGIKAHPDRQPGQSYPGYLFRRWTMIEYSHVGIGSNQFAQVAREFLSKGRITGRSLSEGMTKALASYAEPAPVWATGWTPEEPDEWFAEDDVGAIVVRAKQFRSEHAEADVSKKWKKAPRTKDASGMTETVGSDGGATVAEEEKVESPASVQCVYLPKEKFPTEDDAKRWLEKNGLKADGLTSSTNDWRAEQFPESECSDQSQAHEVGDGVRLTRCQARMETPGQPAEGVPQPSKSVTATTPYFYRQRLGNAEVEVGFATHEELLAHLKAIDDQLPPSPKTPERTEAPMTKTACADKTACGCGKTAPKPRKQSPKPVTKDSDADRNSAEMAGEPSGRTEKDDKPVPHTAKMVQDILKHLAAFDEYFENMLPQLEPDSEIGQYLRGDFLDTIKGLATDLHERASAVHEDIEFEKPTESEGADEKEDMERNTDQGEGEPSGRTDKEDMERNTDQGESEPEEKGDEEDRDDIDLEGYSDQAKIDAGTADEGTEPETEDEDEDEDEDKKKARKAAVAKALERGQRLRQPVEKGRHGRYKALCKAATDAADHLQAAGDSEYGDEAMHKVMCSAHKFHAKELFGILGSMDRDRTRPPEGETTDDRNSAALETEPEGQENKELAELEAELATLDLELKYASGTVD